MEVPNTDENMDKCICPSCPSFNDGDVGLFCSVGKSEMDVIQRGCICDECAVQAGYDLSGTYYCVNGKAS